MPQSKLTHRPTTKDIAKAAGVSLATVDRVLNGRKGVKQNTIELVNQAIKTLGFVRNLRAANLAKSQIYRFIFVLPRTGDQFLQKVIQRIEEAEIIYAADHVWCEVQHIDENDPHSIATYLASLSVKDVSGVAIMSPETPQVRDAISRLQERGIAVLPFISNQTLMDADWVGIDNQAAGATAGLLLGQYSAGKKGSIMVISESMQSRDSLERRLGFDKIINEDFPNLRALPSLEIYGSEEKAQSVITANLNAHPDIIGIYVMATEARIPLTIIEASKVSSSVIKIAHERTPFTEQALQNRALDGVIAQDAGHLVRSAIRRLKGVADRRQTFESQENIRIEILLRSNL